MNVSVSPEAVWGKQFDMKVIVGLSFGGHGWEEEFS